MKISGRLPSVGNFNFSTVKGSTCSWVGMDLDQPDGIAEHFYFILMIAIPVHRR